jgi:hypothetical protein
MTAPTMTTMVIIPPYSTAGCSLDILMFPSK